MPSMIRLMLCVRLQLYLDDPFLSVWLSVNENKYEIKHVRLLSKHVVACYDRGKIIYMIFSDHNTRKQNAIVDRTIITNRPRACTVLRDQS